MNHVSTRQVFSFILKMIRPSRGGLFVMVWTASIWTIDLFLRTYILRGILNQLSDNKGQDIFEDLVLPICLHLGMYLLMFMLQKRIGFEDLKCSALEAFANMKKIFYNPSASILQSVVFSSRI